MARGITSFTGYTKNHKPGGTYYKCTECSFGSFRQRGNALAMHNKIVAAIKKHAEQKHGVVWDPKTKDHTKPEPSPIEGVFLRPIMLHVCKDGTLTYRDKTKKEKVFNGVALPVFSVDTIEEAKRIQARFCRLQYGKHPHKNGPEQWYTLTVFSGELDDLDRVMADFATFWAEHIKGTDSAKTWARKLRYQLVDKVKRQAARAE